MIRVSKELLIEKVKELCMSANYDLGQDTINIYKEKLSKEEKPLGKEILQQIIDNADIAVKNRQPLCQDTGFAVFFVELGRDIQLDFDIEQAINEGVRQGYKDGYLRKSIVADPLNRTNTGDNTPSIIHLKSVAGDKIKISFAPKGGGSENMSALKMLVPADGVEGIKQFVIDTVIKAGANVCPPSIVGIGIGGTFEKAALLAKQSLLREIGSENKDPFYNNLEKEWLEDINKLNIGPMGLGGNTTCLDVFIDIYPCHIASLPVAVNMQCHSARHKEIVI